MTDLLTDDAELAKIEGRYGLLPKGYAIPRDVTQPGPDSDEEWAIDHDGCEVAYCLGKLAEEYATFFSTTLTDFPRAVATIRVLKAALEHIVALECKEYPRYPVLAQVVGEYGEFDVGVNTGRREAAEIARAALRGEEAPCPSD